MTTMLAARSRPHYDLDQACRRVRADTLFDECQAVPRAIGGRRSRADQAMPRLSGGLRWRRHSRSR